MAKSNVFLAARMSLAALGLFLPPLTAIAFGQYIRQGPIGSASKETPAPILPAGYRRLPIEEWEGKRILFMPQSVSLRMYGYQSFAHEHPKLFDIVAYDECAGKIARILSVTSGPYPKVLVQIEAANTRLIGTVYSGSLKGVMFLDELDQARKDFISSCRFGSPPSLPLTYDPRTDKYGTVHFKEI